MSALAKFRQKEDFYKDQSLDLLDENIEPSQIISCYNDNYYRSKAFKKLVNRINSSGELVKILQLFKEDHYRSESVENFASHWRINSSQISKVLETFHEPYNKHSSLICLLKTCTCDSIDIIQILKIINDSHYQFESLECLLATLKKCRPSDQKFTSEITNLEMMKQILGLFNQQNQSDYENYKVQAFEKLWNFIGIDDKKTILLTPLVLLKLFNTRTSPYIYDKLEQHLNLDKNSKEFKELEEFIENAEQQSINFPKCSKESKNSNNSSIVDEHGNINCRGGAISISTSIVNGVRSSIIVTEGGKTIINGRTIDNTPERKFKFFSEIKGLPTEQESIRQHEEDVRELMKDPSDVCLSCSKAKKSYLCLPCGHLTLCSKCVRLRYQKCRISDQTCLSCQKTIKKVVRVKRS